ncbi:MAG: hypothetical protein GY938_22885 [Ketobacter sp.]|nr:hypothetical protein [Ketobacter sp.]
MERLIKTSKLLGLSAVGVILLACSKTLLWETNYSTASANIAIGAAVDPVGSVYIAGTSRANPESSGFDYRGLLLKYSADGQLEWSKEYEELTHLMTATPLGEGKLIVSGTQGGPSGTLSSGTFYLASAQDGSLIKELLSAPNHTKSSYSAEGQNQAYFVSQQTDDPNSGYQLLAYDTEGELIHTSAISGTTYAIKNNPNGSIYLLNRNGWDSGLRLYALNSDFSIQWTSDELHNLDCHSFSTYESNDIAVDSNNDIIVKCDSAFSKLDANGTQRFSASYADLFDSNSSDSLYYFEHGPSQISFDDDNNLYISTTRAVLFEGQIGNLIIAESSYSLVKSDALVIKYDGATGERLWSDDVDAFLTATETGVTADYYYPMHASVTNGKLQVTVRGFRGHYIGRVAATSTSPAICNNLVVEGVLPPHNECLLDSIADAYAKTLYYNLETGKRSSGSRYNEDYPSAAVLAPNNTLILVGDDTWEGTTNWLEMGSQALSFLDQDEDRWAESRDFSVDSPSHIYVQKHSL